jgi:hypothetical protein
MLRRSPDEALFRAFTLIEKLVPCRSDTTPVPSLGTHGLFRQRYRATTVGVAGGLGGELLGSHP